MDARFKRNLLYSAGLHVGLFLLLVVGTVLAGRMPRQETFIVLEMDLFDSAGGGGPASGPAPEPEEALEPEPEPEPELEEEDVVAPEPKKEQEKPKPEPKPELTRQERIERMRKSATAAPQEPRPAAPRASANLGDQIGRLVGPAPRGAVGSGGGGGSGRGGSNQYVALVVARLKALWQAPLQARSAPVKPVVTFTVEPDGRVTGVRFLTRSGDPVLDQSVQAIFTSDLRVTPPPKELGPSFELEVRFVPTD